MGVWLFAASVMPVIALVTPGPWCTETTASRPEIRPYASAMQAAPFSWAAATNRAPAATIAFVTWKLPLPTTPKTWSAPCATSVRPTTSATSMALALHQREHAAGAARAVHDGQRARDHDRARGRQSGQVLQLGQSVLVVPE